MSEFRILVVEDEKYNRDFYCQILQEKKYGVDLAATLAEGREKCESVQPDLILLDLKFDREESDEGLQFLKRVRKSNPQIEVVVISGSRRDSTKIKAILDFGAFDYLEKPIRRDVLLLVVNRAQERIRLKNENVRLKNNLANVKKLDGYFGMIGQSPQMQDVFEKIKKIARFESTVLITGETGTGKELAARAIHKQSGRSGLMAIDIGVLSSELAGSELFGHKRGAFTGAINDRKGKIEAAGSGTVFLDEIENISPDVQQKLLRLLEQREYNPIGSNQTIDTDARFIIATNVDLEERVAAGAFRQDLYHRLNVINIEIPPLRERDGDIEMLAHSFLSIHSKSLDIYKSFSNTAMQKLKDYSWPGNVRELKNSIEEALIFGVDADEVLPEDVNLSTHSDPPPIRETGGHIRTLKQVEIDAKIAAIYSALEETSGVAAQAARLLDVTPRHLRRLMDEYDISV
jgi:DNA-binding NtrC family response regulator